MCSVAVKGAESVQRSKPGGGDGNGAEAAAAAAEASFLVTRQELAELNEDQQVKWRLRCPMHAFRIDGIVHGVSHASLTHTVGRPIDPTQSNTQTQENVARLRERGGVSWLLKALKTDRDKGWVGVAVVVGVDLPVEWMDGFIGLMLGKWTGGCDPQHM